MISLVLALVLLASPALAEEGWHQHRHHHEGFGEEFLERVLPPPPPRYEPRYPSYMCGYDRYGRPYYCRYW